MRIWEKEVIEAGSPTKKKFLSYVIRCGSPGCQEMAVGGGNIGRYSAHDALPKIFGQKGWTVGSKPRHDRCPRCTRKHADGQRVLEEKVIPMKKENVTGFLAQALPGKQAKPPETHVHAPAPPDTMTRQDRRVIFQKLEEVYVDENVGYSNGWNDDAVATDLGVPVAWVASVRDENFGPNKSEQVAKMIEEGRQLWQQAIEVFGRAEQHANGMKAAMTELSKLQLRLDKFDKDLKDLAKKSK